MRVDPFCDVDLAAAVLDALALAGVAGPVRVEGVAASGAWRTALERHDPLGVGDGPVAVVASPDALPGADDQRAWVEELTSSAAVVVLATVTPAGATSGHGRWPAHWADLFSTVGWRFIDLLRPVLWDDPRFGPDAKEGWLLFVAPGALPAHSASAPLATVHPHRLVEAVRGVNAEVASLRTEFLDGLRAVAQRQELEELRREVAGVRAEAARQRVDLRGTSSRLAATERRSILLMEQQLGVEALVVPRPAPESRRRRLARLLGRSGPAPVDPPAVSPVVVALFDAAHYREAHPEAAAAPLTHYLVAGEQAGHRPNPWFDPLHYLERNPDVAQAGMSPLVHFAEFGGAEGRSPSAEFDAAWYVATYPEVGRSGLNPLLHYLVVGAALGYGTSADPVEPVG